MEPLFRDEEIEMLLNDLLDTWGYDFTGYAHASLRRRISRLYLLRAFPSFAEFRYKLKNDSAFFHEFVEEITVNVTEMFRDPNFYRSISEQVFPWLSTKPFIRIWHAGCSTGEEVYSMAIMLKEANLLHKSLLYATDINPSVLENLRKGLFPMQHMKQYSENYIQAGGRLDFSSYYTAQYEWAKFDEVLHSKMIVSTHNLVSDQSFNEFQLIVCRNVLIYFDKGLQERVLRLFDDSLEKLGFLALGSKETLRFSDLSAGYSQLPNREKVWKKIK
ncbi:CheR family methyltransferase [Flavihumibacter petaseus]|uniref:Putative chemotaxis protein methyltransferase n=1 Tax=Flavihumibacter petaseus NBRC 106054 TaxID=1220578 RepID=A0A0E9MWL3_9BACT|nr:protein-glutamate O-methyltransferase CheR [Flavihumibacter petaseus]GAO41878.1 putative chemotaxis protein methyltransferase [Flavihumibacter petaseus NBRC 106054]